MDKTRCLYATGNMVIKAGLGKNASRQPAQTRQKPEKHTLSAVLEFSTSDKNWGNRTW
jgi:hypothetical protein